MFTGIITDLGEITSITPTIRISVRSCAASSRRAGGGGSVPPGPGGHAFESKNIAPA